MARKIAWADVPEWVREEIKECGLVYTSQISKADGSLSIRGGKVYFNCVEVAMEGEVVDPTDNVEETITLTKLPIWALMKLATTPPGSSVQCIQNGDALIISADGNALFNDKKVEKVL